MFEIMKIYYIRFLLVGIAAFAVGFTIATWPHHNTEPLAKSFSPNTAARQAEMSKCMEIHCAAEMLACYTTKGCEETATCISNCVGVNDEKTSSLCIQACEDYTEPMTDLAVGNFFLCGLTKCMSKPVAPRGIDM